MTDPGPRAAEPTTDTPTSTPVTVPDAPAGVADAPAATADPVIPGRPARPGMTG
ncbi:hypothetical protein H8N00_24555, partial [Streptomyces sp. AC563]|nr:hypothetical protein [Streptomyces buecherae]